MRPKDDYIQRFIKDVNRGRFIKVEAVMDEAPRDQSASLPRLKVGTTLEAAAKELTNSPCDEAVIVDGVGKPVGLVSLRQITAALSATERHMDSAHT